MSKHPLEKFGYCPLCGSREFRVSTVKSKKCGACGFELFMNPSAATAAFIIDEMGKILVVRRAEEPAKGTLDLPGGFSDISETSEEGVRREVMEETGLTVTASRFLFSLPNTYHYSGIDIPTIDMFYLCSVENTDNLAARDDAAEAFWMPINDLNPDEFGLNSVSRAVRLFVEKHQNGL